jgi:hypothetical protein
MITNASVVIMASYRLPLRFGPISPYRIATASQMSAQAHTGRIPASRLNVSMTGPRPLRWVPGAGFVAVLMLPGSPPRTGRPDGRP